MLVTEDPTQNNNRFGSPKNQDVISSPNDEVGEPSFLHADELSHQPRFLESDAEESSDATGTSHFEPQHHVLSLN